MGRKICEGKYGKENKGRKIRDWKEGKLKVKKSDGKERKSELKGKG